MRIFIELSVEPERDVKAFLLNLRAAVHETVRTYGVTRAKFIRIGETAAATHEWFPIESAPKDGTRILAAGNGFLPIIVSWFDKTPESNRGFCIYPAKPSGWYSEHRSYAYLPSTWMPIPPLS